MKALQCFAQIAYQSYGSPPLLLRIPHKTVRLRDLSRNPKYRPACLFIGFLTLVSVEKIERHRQIVHSSSISVSRGVLPTCILSNLQR